MGKPQKNPKNLNENGKKIDNFPQDKNDISANVEQKIKDALNVLNTKDKKELEKRLGTGDFFEQLRKYFEEKHPSLLDEIENKDKLKIYIDQLKNHGFSILNLTENAKTLDNSFSESESEYNVTEKSITKLQKYCEEEADALPGGIFSKFAQFAKIETTPISIEAGSKIKTAADVKKQRNKFLEDQKIELKETQKNELNKIVDPKYAPTTRLLVSAAIKKVKKSLPKHLQEKFDKEFPKEITITSEIQNLTDFKNHRQLFLQANQKDIDKDLAKKLDGVRVLNQDMYDEFKNEGISPDKAKGFSEQEQEFRLIFNKLATRQLFDQVNKANTIAETQIQNIGEIFKGFPPYLNDIFKIHTYNDSKIRNIDPTFEKDIGDFDNKIKELELGIAVDKEGNDTKSDAEKEPIIQKIKKLRKEKNDRKRAGYVKRLSTQDAKLGSIVGNLSQNNFDMNKLDKASQQVIIDDLVKNKLELVVSEGTAESLGVDQDRFLGLMKDFFDLDKKQITIPSPNGDIVFDCPEKSFLGGPLSKSMEIGLKGPSLTEDEKRNLPLNLKLLLTEDNKDFFEKSPIFGDLFDKFESRNGTKVLNDSYKVRVKNNKGQIVEGYLSNYPPKGPKGEAANDRYQNATNSQGGRYLYSKPITRPEDDRELVFRDDDNGVIISDNETQNYDLDILSRSLNMNGKGIGALLFGTTVGQYSEENQIVPESIKKLDESFEKLDKEKDLYKDTLENQEKEPEETEKKSEKKEEKESDAEFKKTIEAWKKLGGYQTIEDKDKGKDSINTYGLEKGAKLMIPFFEPSLLPPDQSGTKGFLTLEIVSDITKTSDTFKVKLSGGESKIGGYEGFEKTLPLTAKGIENIEKAFGAKPYKLPKNIEQNPNNMISILEQAGIDDLDPSLFFKNLERGGNGWIQKVDGKKEDVMYFGKLEAPAGEAIAAGPVLETICKVEYSAGKARPYTVYIDDRQGVGDKAKHERVKTEMDAINFALFIASKKLSPRTKDDVEKTKKEKESKVTQAQPPQKVPISISSIKSLFKGVSKKVGDGLKKYQDKQEEDLTEAIMFEGKLMSKLAGIMPSEKLKYAFTKVSDEYLLERDNKVWKKIEDYKNEMTKDPDFGGDKMRVEKIKPFLDGVKSLDGKKDGENHWKAAAILLATIEKGKGPYSRNADRAGKGNWIKILFGEKHQKLYLNLKKERELEIAGGVNLNGQTWANEKQNALLKLEMTYITHLIDGRQMRDNEDTPIVESMYSKKFAGELEGASNKFFNEERENAYNKTKDISFDLARFEYFRLLGDRPQQAIGNLKAVAEKANNKGQWEMFEQMVWTGMLCGIFHNITQEDKKFMEKVCRTAGFLPGLLMRQPNAHHKGAKLLDIATGGKFSSGGFKYNPDSFNFGKMDPGQTKTFIGDFGKRYPANRKNIKDFISFQGKNAEGKKLIELFEDPKTPNDQKQVLKDILDKKNEVNEDLDPQVKENGKSLQQNLLCRNQSLIKEIIGFQDGQFKGKDNDAIEDAKSTRKGIKSTVNDIKIENDNDAIFTLKMFGNRFSEKGFSSEGKKTLIRTLKTVKEEKAKGNRESADLILRYTIVGKIIKSSGSGQVPDELKGGLEAFKDFFDNNLDRILSEKVIAEGFGQDYTKELNKKAYKVAPRDRFVKTKVYTGALANTLPKEEKTKINEDRVAFKGELYINEKLFDLAKKLDEGEYGIPNAFKPMYDQEQDRKDIKKQLQETLSRDSINLTNHNKITKAERKKERLNDNLTEEEQEILEEEEMEDEDFDDE